MTNLWITRDRGSALVFLWDSMPQYGNGVWNLDEKMSDAMSSLKPSAAKSILGDQWSDAGPFCFQIDIASITQVLSRPEKLANQLRAMTRDTCCSETLLEAADLIERLSQK